MLDKENKRPKRNFLKIQWSSVLFLVFFLVLLKVYWIYVAFYAFFGSKLLSIQMISGFLWQDFIFFAWILWLTLLILQKKSKIIKKLATMLFYIFLSVFILDILFLLFWRQRFFLFESVNMFLGLETWWRLFSLFGSIFAFVAIICILLFLWNILLKKFKTRKNILAYIIAGFLCLWVAGNVLSQNKVGEEWQNVCVSIAREIIETDQKEIITDVDLNWRSPTEMMKDLQTIEDSKTVKQILLYFANNNPQIIFDNYDILQNLESVHNIDVDEILEISAINNNIADYSDYFVDIEGEWHKQNLILIFLESFSAVDSKRVSGINDNFPLFDKIQSQWTTFTNFMSNAHNSERSHITTLQWIEPLTFFKVSAPYYTLYHGYTDPLPVFFNKKGYSTYFISSVTLEFLNQRKFLERLQFQHIIGEEAFSWKQTYTFDAAPDWDLYDKILEVIDQQTWQYFIWTQTISSHEPYLTPDWNWKEKMFAYSDRELDRFYSGLVARNFFDNWILVMFGDHRKREEITQAEIDKYGKSSEARILATVIWTGITPNINNNLYQHIDIFYSLKHFFGDWKLKVMKYYNDIFDGEIRREWGLKEWWVNGKFLLVDTKKTDAIIQYNKWKISFWDTINYPDALEIIQYLNALLKYQKDMIININQNNTNTIKIIAHRGNSEYFLDNTIEAIESAKNKWVDGIEFDVSFTKDGYNVVLHWPSMKNTICGIEKKVYDLTLEEVKKCTLNNGETILTLNEFLKKTKDRFPLYFLEIKVTDPELAEAQTIDAIQNVIQEWLTDKVVFTSYNLLSTYILSSYDNILSAWDTDKSEDIEKIKDSRHSYFMTNFENISLDLMQKVNLYKKSFLAYTINDPETMEKLYQMGVREFLTDNLDMARQRKRSKLAEE